MLKLLVVRSLMVLSMSLVCLAESAKAEIPPACGQEECQCQDLSIPYSVKGSSVPYSEMYEYLRTKIKDGDLYNGYTSSYS